jgi:hypothetical protein
MRWLSWWVVVSFLAAGLVIYALFGQQVIAAIYRAENPWVDAILSGRASTPLEAYYRSADVLVLTASLWLVGGYAVLRALLRQPLGAMVFGGSLALTSFSLFWFFEVFPGLIPVFRLQIVSPYYAYKVNYLPDPELGFREKPFNRAVIDGFAGARYSPVYDIDVVPMTIEWKMDQDGFRNARATDSSDVILLGDSYLEYGTNDVDTFGGRLEGKLPGLTVRNLGKSGYSPFQYLTVLKRYGLKYKPRYAVMAFYEGNDISETREYLLWKSGRLSGWRGFLLKFSTDSLIRRYWAALAATSSHLHSAFNGGRERVLHRLAQSRGYAHVTHPDIAHLDLQGNAYRKLFIDQLPAATPEELLASEEFAALKKVFGEFRDLSRANGIMPMVLYIPTAVQIYAPYSTKASGVNWLKEVKTQIAVRRNTEAAVSALARGAGVDFFSLTPVFGGAAAQGKMVYYPLDAHWNAEGREIAASFMAQTLQSKYLDGARKRAK